MNNRVLSVAVVLSSLAVLSLLSAPVLAQSAPSNAPELRSAPEKADNAPSNAPAKAHAASNTPELRTAAENEGNASHNAGSTSKETKDNTDNKPPELFPIKYMIPLLGVFVLLMWFSSRSKRKQEQKRKEMLSNIKKGDKVTSIGGIIGSVVEVREDEVVVKVDDNTRMKFARWAIRGIGEESKAENPDQGNKAGEEKK